jgi:tRNA modification GTPase
MFVPDDLVCQTVDLLSASHDVLTSLDDTIAALASAAGSSPRGVVRVAGRYAIHDVRRSVHVAGEQWPAKRVGLVRGEFSLELWERSVRLPVTALVWPTNRSFTGQPTVELHTVGSPVLLDAMLAELYQHGIRPAQPGEFTMRAFLAGRVDLMQAEAVLGVIDARDPLELKAALDQLGGGLAGEITRLRSEWLDLLADLEAGLDFADEAIEFVPHAVLVRRLQHSRCVLGDLRKRAAARWSTNVRPRVVLAGAPNAGKSTLFNALVGTDAAIVSDVRGTTRDYLTAEIECDGVAITLVDTAGFDLAVQHPSGVDAAAQQARECQTRSADLVLWCSSADAASTPTSDVPATRLIAVRTKSDLTSPPRFESVIPVSAIPIPVIPVSARTGTGLKELRSAVATVLRVAHAESDRPFVGTTAARCTALLAGAAAAIDRSLELAAAEADQDLLAFELRLALDELGQVTGAVYTDEILDRIFSRFCIGK